MIKKILLGIVAVITLTLFMDCESICGPEFEKGLADLAKVIALPAK